MIILAKQALLLRQSHYTDGNFWAQLRVLKRKELQMKDSPSPTRVNTGTLPWQQRPTTITKVLASSSVVRLNTVQVPAPEDGSGPGTEQVPAPAQDYQPPSPAPVEVNCITDSATSTPSIFSELSLSSSDY